MLKVVEWLIGGIAAVAVWIAALLNIRSLDLSPVEKSFILYLPIWGVLAFGIVSISIIAYRTATLQDCPAAAKELQQQILEAKTDLKRKDLKF